MPPHCRPKLAILKALSTFNNLVLPGQATIRKTFDNQELDKILKRGSVPAASHGQVQSFERPTTQTSLPFADLRPDVRFRPNLQVSLRVTVSLVTLIIVMKQGLP